MHLNSISIAAIAASVLPAAEAFWRLPCRGRLGVARLDPLVDPGKISSHAHAIHGGSNFGLSVTPDLLQLSECTSCAVKQDKSIYWTPALYFEHPDGSTELVDQAGGMLVYYLLYGDNPQPFPKGFRMLAGDTFRRNFSLPVPDPPKSEWHGEDSTQSALQQKAVGMNCLNYNKPGEPTLYRHTMPDKDYLDENCVDGLRMEMMFPSCWNGKDLDSEDHKSHVVYPSLVMDGVCPEGYETRLVSLLYETIWNTQDFKGKEGRFLIANGDPTGCGYHGDFIEGWDDNVLGQAVKQCTNPSGVVQDCPVFDLQGESDMEKCKYNIAADIYDEDCLEVKTGLPGNVKVFPGPGAAKPGHSPSSTPGISLSVSLPSLGYTPAPSTTASASASASAPPSAPPSPSLSVSSLSPAGFYAVDSSSSMSTPSTTPSPSTPSVDADATPIATSYSTNGDTVYELIIVQEEVTTTLDLPCDCTPAPEVTEGKSAYKRIARRHAHGHAHGHKH